MNAARNTARILAHRWRLIGNIKQHPLLQRAEFIYLTYNPIRPFTLSSHCRQEAPVNGDEGTINVTYQEFVHHLKNPSSTVIDVRNPKELVDTGMFPGSINIPLPILTETLDLPADNFQYLFGVSKPAATDDIIFACKMGIRSQKAIMIALGKGFQRVRHYPGGWVGWEEEQKKTNQ